MSEVSPSAAKFYGDGEPDIDKQLDWLIEKEEKAAQEKSKEGNMDEEVTEDNIDKLLTEDDNNEKGHAETAGSGKEEDGSGEPGPEKRDLSGPDVSSPELEPEAGEAAHDAEDKSSPSAKTETASSPQPGSREEDGDDYTLTDDQRQAMAELDNMKGDPEYDYLPEDPPEYDVSERIKLLNAELETDGVPVNEDRVVKVGFKQNLVDLVAPPPVFSDDEEEHEQETNQSNESASEDTQKPKGKENKVLIERDGKFELVDSDDPLAAEYGGLPHAVGAGDSSLSPSPPSQPRPATANGFSRQQRHQPNRRAQSAHISRDQDDDWSSGYKSPYALSEAQKAIKQERDKALLRRQRAEAEQKKEDEEEKRKDNEDAFQAWLNRKREDAARRHQEEKEAASQRVKTSESSDAGSGSSAANSTGSTEAEDDRDSEGAFREWLQVKAKQKQKEKEMEGEKIREVQDGYYYRTRKDCDKAYKAWLKKKNADMKNSKDYKKKKQSIAMLYLRRSRKSQALARAIQYSHSFRYVDYYGYRV
ncbi:coiled-coil domain-containing protein 181-like isoform X2 [Lineus longissimus]|uniref:coiled-coil domain-containing protein 181-like isoform X2 n=1 Tax=Lineus longissimus TaxID=88925 RepID=UPI00315D9537